VILGSLPLENATWCFPHSRIPEASTAQRRRRPGQGSLQGVCLNLEQPADAKSSLLQARQCGLLALTGPVDFKTHPTSLLEACSSSSNGQSPVTTQQHCICTKSRAGRERKGEVEKEDSIARQPESCGLVEARAALQRTFQSGDTASLDEAQR
jgi:hypothetical protein